MMAEIGSGANTRGLITRASTSAPARRSTNGAGSIRDSSAGAHIEEMNAGQQAWARGLVAAVAAAETRAHEAEMNMASMATKLDQDLNARADAAEARARKAEQESQRLRSRLEVMQAGLRQWMPEEEWAKYS